MRIFVCMCLVVGLLADLPAAMCESKLPDEVFKEFAVSKSMELKLENVPKEGWEVFTIPHFFRNTNGVYYRGDINFDGKGLVVLRFGAVMFTCTLWVNDQFVGTHVGGYLPFEYNITGLLRGGKNTAILGVLHPATAVGAPIGPANLLKMKENSLLYPIGSAAQFGGLWQATKLVMLPEIHIKNIYVQTSVRNRELSAQVEVGAGAGGESLCCYKLQASVKDKNGKTVLDLGKKSGVIAGNPTEYEEFLSPWQNPLLWSPERPNLYWLEVELFDKSGAMLHEKKVRFGFREFWAKDGDFFLNGTRIYLRACSRHLGWPTEVKTTWRDFAKEIVGIAKSFNANILRLHANPYPEEFLEAADEMGMMIVDESAAWTFGRQYALENEVFWNNLRREWDVHIQRDYNHPSFVIASVENELMLTGGATRKNIEERLATLGAYVKEQSGRLIMFEGDFDPKGTADIINLHYPWEPPTHFNYPNDAYFAAGKFMTDIFPGKEFEWDRSKPLYIGECLWMPGPIHEYAVTEGDAAFEDFLRGRRDSKARLFEMYIQAFRDIGVSAFNPWNPFEGQYEAEGQTSEKQMLQEVIRQGYKPVRFFVREYDRHHYAGKSIQRTLTIQNWSEAPKQLKLEWSFGKIVADTQTGKWEGRLDPSSSKVLTVTLQLPGALVSGQETVWDGLPWQISLTSNGEVAHKESYEIYVASPPTKLPEFTLLGTNPELSKTLDRLSFFHKKADDVSEIVSGPVVVAHGFLPANPKESAKILSKIAEKGLKYIILGWQDPKSITFAKLRGPIEANERYKREVEFYFSSTSFSANFGKFKRDQLLNYFAGDNTLSTGAFELVPGKPCLPLAACATGGGMLYSLVEIPGKGFATTLEIASKFDTEPRCAEILKVLIEKAAEMAARPERSLVASSDVAKGYVSRLGFDASIKTGVPKVYYVFKTDLLRMKDFEKNSVVILDRPTPEDIEKRFGVKIELSKPAIPKGIQITPTPEFASLPRAAIIDSTGFYYQHNLGIVQNLGTNMIEKLQQKTGLKYEWVLPGYIVKITGFDKTVILNYLDWDKKLNTPLSVLLLNLGVKNKS